MMDPIELTYALRLLPASRIAFRRWKWELWHGPHLLAAGWRVSPVAAQRAVRGHAFHYAHRLHGLHPLRPERPQPRETPWYGRRIAVNWGELRVVLTPREVQDPLSA